MTFLRWLRRTLRCALIGLRWRLYEYGVRLHFNVVKPAPTELTTAQSLGGSPQAGDGGRVQWLRSALKRIPYWHAGHLELAKIALANEDILTAHASACAVLQLAPSSREGNLLLGKVLLRRGMGAPALEHLKKVHERDMDEMDVLGVEAVKDAAAAYLLLGNHGEARKLLERLAPEARDAPTAAALQYARRASEQASVDTPSKEH